jgi:hypothetical protein
MQRNIVKSLALGGALTLAASGCAWMGRASQTTASDPLGARTDHPALSSDGRYVVYAAHTDSSAPGVLDGVYRWDIATDTRSLVSKASNGAIADDASGEPAISADGRFVAFSSDATNLVPNDNNDTTDVFVRDMVNRTTERVSVTSTGAEVSDPSYTPSISADGRFVGFISDSDDLSSSDDNLSSDAYVFDRSNRTVRLASIVGGVQPDFGISDAVLSGDGKHVAFTTDTDLVSGDQNGDDDVYLKNLATGSTTWISKPKKLDPDWGGGGGDSPSVSFDGQYVAYVGYTSDLDEATDPFVGPDVFVRDTVNKVTQRVSTTPAGAVVNGGSLNPAITSDGTRVVFASTGNVSGTDTNGTRTDVFVKDRVSGKVTLVSTDMFLGQQAADSNLPAISNDGRYVGFVSTGRFTTDDTNNAGDVFVRAIDVPTVSSIAPTSASRGTSVTLTLTGSKFLAGATVIPLDGVYGVTAQNVSSTTSMTVTLSIPANAPTGPQTIYVRDPGTGAGPNTGGVGRCENCLTIK